MTSVEEFDYTQPTQPFEETTQATQDDVSQTSQQAVGKLVWKRNHDIYLDSPVVVGRHRSCHIQVTSAVSSNRHCTISASFDKESNDYLVLCKDLSSNGTFWNSKKIGKEQTVILEHGDVIEIKKGYYFTFLRLTKKREVNEADLVDSKYQITETVLGKGTFAEIRLA
ncbi:hypothetical protein IW143_003737, partial [Coemansia sp. RSA 520]